MDKRALSERDICTRPASGRMGCDAGYKGTGSPSRGAVSAPTPTCPAGGYPAPRVGRPLVSFPAGCCIGWPTARRVSWRPDATASGLGR
jgi:hypothetical protein